MNGSIDLSRVHTQNSFKPNSPNQFQENGLLIMPCSHLQYKVFSYRFHTVSSHSHSNRFKFNPNYGKGRLDRPIIFTVHYQTFQLHVPKLEKKKKKT
jgi:hypothetical protein